MSTNDFIINMLNIDRNIIERITTIKSSDNIIAKIRLKPNHVYVLIVIPK